MKYIELKKGSPCLKKEVGGKGYGLLQLLNLNLTIPKTFIICEQRETLSTETIKALSAFIQSVLQSDAEATFAVRSSGVAEDGKQRSFAGMFQTFLNVKPYDVMSKIYEVMNVNSNRLIEYSARFNERNLALAIVVQKMIVPKFSGVAFSKNPVTNNEKEIIIEITLGDGEKLVSGEITPSQIVYNKDSQQYTVETGEGVVELPQSQVLELCNIVCHIEKHLSCCVDVEFCIEKNDRLCFLQARPITT